MNIIRSVTTKERLYLIQEQRCFYCCSKLSSGSYLQYVRPNGYTIDHVIPRHTGITGSGNKVLACHHCNNDKGGRLPSVKALRKYELLYAAMSEWPYVDNRRLRRLRNWRLPYY